MSFEKLYSIDVSGKTEKKGRLTYLSWAWAWAEFKKIHTNATYEIKKFDNLPYVFDKATGYMVFTSVTVGELTHDMWLPVMDSYNHAMKDVDYAFKDKYGKQKTVQAATMFDINKTIMRCLTKNLAMFGLGLYIYAGEDLPEPLEPELNKNHFGALYSKVKSVGLTTEEAKQLVKDMFNKTSAKQLTMEEFKKLMNELDKIQISMKLHELDKIPEKTE